MPISAEDKIYKKIAPTRDTHANWTLHNPVLPEGVVGAVKDRLWSGSLEFVMGDGISTYTELPKSAVEPSDNIPLPDADIGSAGAETNYARGGHIHPRGPRSKAYVNAESDEAILADTKAGDIIIRKVNDILEILARGDVALSSLLKSVLLDSEGKVPADRLRIVGALDAGAVIESGSNANGSYTKFADGTFVCRHTVSLTGLSVAAGTVIYNAINWTLPVTATGGDFVKTIVNAILKDSNTNIIYAGFALDAYGAMVYNTGGLCNNLTPGQAVTGLGSSVCNSAVIKLFGYGRWY